MDTDFAAWLASTGSTGSPTAAGRAALAWARIQDKPTTIVLKTAAGASRAAQVVRVEVDNRAGIDSGPAGAGPLMTAIIFGIRGHSTLPDTLMAEGDRFVLGGDSYRIQDIILTTGEIQGVAVATG